MIRFVHTADWQIGKPFGGYPDETRAELRAERFNAVRRIAVLAQERAADFVVVAGDAFDGNTISDRDIQRTLDAMAAFSGPWVCLPGNHDPAVSVSVWSRLQRFEHRARLVVADRPAPIELCDGRAVVLPAPLVRHREGADLTEWYDMAETSSHVIRVGLAHGAVANRLPAAAESGNPIADDRADRARLDYLALGDWHGFLEIAPRTFYSGTPEADRYPANEPGFVALVEIDAPGAEPRVETLRTARFDWRAMVVDVHGDAAALDHALAAIASPGEALVDLTLRGTLSLRERIALDETLAGWQRRLFDLRVRDDDLLDEPDEEDLDRIDAAGFVRTAVDRLRAKAASREDPERAAAALALRMMFAEHARLGRREA
ncbi:DNA repair exonuclease [Aureimonas sp. Leaf324]|uniref:metallophosphoesterase family protein n=1 Tax=Aureimonas sp. Leaf324 TaxID=1736336 RepID=UPI0006F467DB|nr:DNA repair exonuclease [Aureimonas sp. Leaf324]KQQ85822.1 metallophosphoesterase [Aureimonas sp. Leaf324]